MDCISIKITILVWGYMDIEDVKLGIFKNVKKMAISILTK